MVKIIEYTLTVRNNGEIVLSSDGKEYERHKFDETQLKHIRHGINALKKKKYNERQEFIYFGQLLYKTLIKPIESKFKVSWNEDIINSKKKACLRLRLFFEEFKSSTDLVSKIINLPWEFLCYADDNDKFLGTDDRMGISYHYQNWLNNPIDDSPIQEIPLRVLFVHTHPDDLPKVGFDKFVCKQIFKLTEKVELINLLDPTIEKLKEAIEKKPHILHFLGHGKPGNLALRNHEVGDALWFPDQSLSDLICSNDIKLVVLQACEGAASSVDFSFSGTASQVVKSHIPAVIAFRYPIEQPLAWKFIKTFYTNVSEGKPLDIAVQAGRNTLADNSHSSRDFGSPVLWMRWRNGILFNSNIQNEFENKSSDIENQEIFDDPFYVKRPPIEDDCYKEIFKPGSFIRIKAPQKMGKTLLLNRIMAYAQAHQYKTAILNFGLPDTSIFEKNNIDKFLKWFCTKTSKILCLENKVSNYWDSDYLTNNDNCTNYFEEYILQQLTTPLVLGLRKVDRVFENRELANDFCCLLRSWLDMATQNNHQGQRWKKLRLIIVHSTNIYSSLDINHSPLNIGKTIFLPDFTSEQIKNLAQAYELNWTNQEIEQLMSMLEGNPHLVRKAIEYIKDYKITIESFLKVITTEKSPFNNHLREHLNNFENNPELALALFEVVNSQKPIKLKTKHIFKLDSLGLIQIHGNYCTPKCNLYREYFLNRL